MIRAVKVKLKQRRQTLWEGTTTIDPDDDVAVRALLASLALTRGIKHPDATHSVELYKPSGEYLREVTAA